LKEKKLLNIQAVALNGSKKENLNLLYVASKVKQNTFEEK